MQAGRASLHPWLFYPKPLELSHACLPCPTTSPQLGEPLCYGQPMTEDMAMSHPDGG